MEMEDKHIELHVLLIEQDTQCCIHYSEDPLVITVFSS